MDFSHAHLYVDDAAAWQRWFENVLGFTAVNPQTIPGGTLPQTQTTAVKAGRVCFLLSSPLSRTSPVAQYLRERAPGVVDLAFCVRNLDDLLANAAAHGVKSLGPITTTVSDRGPCRWVRLSGWGGLQHTVMESRSVEALPANLRGITGIDHAVLNVPRGEMLAAVDWYEAAFTLRRHQAFAIQTARSALCSQVLQHPGGDLQLPINEPTSPTSQVQEFLDVNGGAGVQHIALQTTDIVATVRALRQRGLNFLTVPDTYYDTLSQRAGFSLSAAQQAAIAEAQILVDWQPGQSQTLLLQTFTQPIFGEPTFFFELIQRQTYDLRGVPQYASGFGEGNFQALFEAMEREQIKRGWL